MLSLDLITLNHAACKLKIDASGRLKNTTHIKTDSWHDQMDFSWNIKNTTIEGK